MAKPTPTQIEKFFEGEQIIVSKTDTKGIITYGNDVFIRLSGYSEEELLGAPHNIIRHPDMPRVVFKLLWDTVGAGKEIFAYVKNLSKEGHFYWVLANVTPSYNSDGKVIGYHSVRRRPRREALEVIAPIYKELLKAESNGGMKESGRVIGEFLASKNMSYEEFILSI
ncbi:MAG: PAS domain-containing protein [Wolinella sp.]